MHAIKSIIRFTLTLYSVLMLSSCDDSVSPVVEEIAASPLSFELSSESSNCIVQVTANCSWKTEVKPIDGIDASWIVLGKSQGKGDATLNFRVLQNKYNSDRKAEIVLSTEGGKNVSVSVVQAAAEDGEETSSINVRVGSYNIRLSTEDKDATKYPERLWSVRKDRLWASIQDCSFDVVGLQEVTSAVQAELKEKWGSTYDMYFFSPYSKDGKGDKAQGLMFRKTDYNLSDTHFFWIGPDPDVMSSVDIDSNQNKYNRGGFCGILTHKATGIKFFFMNTHGCLNKDTGALYASVFEQMEKRYNTEGLPAFFVGDLNATPDHAMLKTITSYWTDSYKTTKSKKGIANTFNSYTEANGLRRIDYVLYRNVSAPSMYCCDNTLYGGQFASDHFPVYVDFTIVK